MGFLSPQILINRLPVSSWGHLDLIIDVKIRVPSINALPLVQINLQFLLQSLSASMPSIFLFNLVLVIKLILKLTQLVLLKTELILRVPNSLLKLKLRRWRSDLFIIKQLKLL